MSTPTLFAFEAPIVQALQAIPGVHVIPVVTDDAIENLASVQPTVILRWSADNVLDANEGAAVAEREVAVHLLIAGATRDSEATDGELAWQVFDALHGFYLPGHDEPLLYAGGAADFNEGVREYQLTFRFRSLLKPSRRR